MIILLRILNWRDSPKERSLVSNNLSSDEISVNDSHQSFVH